MTENPAPILEEEMTAITEAINQAARAVQQGHPTDLSLLVRRVDSLCAALINLPGADARRIGAGLPAITNVLEDIARVLRDQGAGPAPSSSDSPASHGQAARAYGATLTRGR